MKRIACMFFVALLLSCSAAFADYYSIKSADGPLIYGQYTSPYSMYLSITPSLLGLYDTKKLTCISIDKTIYYGSWYEFTLTVSTDAKVKGAAWLMDPIAPVPAVDGLRNWAAWYLMSGEAAAKAHGLPSSGIFYDAVKLWATEAQDPAHYGMISWVNLYLPTTAGQTFIDGHGVVPEPASMLLFGTALAGTGWLVRRRRKNL